MILQVPVHHPNHILAVPVLLVVLVNRVNQITKLKIDDNNYLLQFYERHVVDVTEIEKIAMSMSNTSTPYNRTITLTTRTRVDNYYGTCASSTTSSCCCIPTRIF
jgi:hypothetical protein